MTVPAPAGDPPQPRPEGVAGALRHRLKFFGWRIVGAGAAIQAMQSGLFMQAFGSYSVLLRNEFGWSATTLSIAFAMTRAESGILGPFQGWLIDRFGPRKVMQVGLVMMAAGFMAFSQIQDLTGFFAFYFLMSVGASLGGFLSVTTAIVNWFQRYRSRALATSQTGFAIGGSLVPLLVFFMETYGWRETAFASGLLVLAIGMPLSILIRHRPSDYGMHPDGLSPEDLEADDSYVAPEGLTKVDFTAGQALRTRAFWMISLGHGASLLVVGSLMLHLPLYLTDDVGMSLQRASFIVGALPMMQLVGQILGGYFGDVMNKRLMVVLAMMGHMVGLLILTYAVNDVMIWAFVPLHGLAWGLRGPLMQSMRADYFGPTNFGTIMGFSSMIVMIGMITGPLLAGFLRDQTGAYTAGFTVLALGAGLGSIFFYLAKPPAPPAAAGGTSEAGVEPETAASVAGG